jgi:large conductance mechanosensitive channel
MKILKEFKSFALKGNMVDMGVGIIIGGAFGQIVNSFVTDIVMPPLGLLTGNVDFADKVWVLKQATEAEAVITLNYGLFINNLLNFVIVALSIFLVIKQMNKIREEFEKEIVEEENNPKEEKPAADIQLLAEIRDLIKKTRI